jgi:hypothetical protein
MKVKRILPLSLLWAWRSADVSDASTLHQCYTRGLWQERGPVARAGLVARLLVWWPISNLAMLAWCTAYNGPATRRTTGKAVWRQVAEQIYVAVRYSIPSPWYYIFDLWDDEKRKNAALYLNRYETKGGIYGFLKRYLGAVRGELGNKLRFHEICLKDRLPVPTLVMHLDQGIITGGKPRLPEADLFVKRRKGRGGHGAASWTYLGGSRYRSHAGEERTGTELLAQLAEQSKEQPLLVQHCLRNHPELADITVGALATARMMTVLDEKREPEFTHAVFRTAVKRNSPVDNFHLGGIAAPVDARSGELGRAVGGGLRGVSSYSDLGSSDTHPLTGVRISGRRLPFWEEAIEIVTRAHRSFPGMAIVGWDVGFTQDGPVLIEGNSAPDLDIIQRCHQIPLGETRLAAALAFHVRQALASTRP